MEFVNNEIEVHIRHYKWVLNDCHKLHMQKTVHVNYNYILIICRQFDIVQNFIDAAEVTLGTALPITIGDLISISDSGTTPTVCMG